MDIEPSKQHLLLSWHTQARTDSNETRSLAHTSYKFLDRSWPKTPPPITTPRSAIPATRVRIKTRDCFTFRLFQLNRNRLRTRQSPHAGLNVRDNRVLLSPHSALHLARRKLQPRCVRVSTNPSDRLYPPPREGKRGPISSVVMTRLPIGWFEPRFWDNTIVLSIHPWQ